MKNTRLAVLLCTTTALCVFAALPAMAANFTITNGQTATTTQSIGPDSGEAGTVEAGGAVIVNGFGENALTSTSAGGILTNSGSITTLGDNGYGIWVQNSANSVKPPLIGPV